MTAPSGRTVVQDLGLLFVIAIVLAGLLPGQPLTPGKLASTFYLALSVHLLVSAYDGRFGRLRTASWFLLICGWIAAEAVAFVSMMLPFGQLRFWLASKFAGWPLVGGWLHQAIGSDTEVAQWIWQGALLVLLGLDLLAMHYPRWRMRAPLRLVLFAVGTIAVAVILAPVIDQLEPKPSIDGLVLLPPWYALPLYELLRAVPSKSAGVGLALAAMLVLLVLPGMRTSRLRESRIGWLWFTLTLVLAGCWIGLGFLGAQAPEGTALLAARLLAAFHFVYFLVLPVLLGRVASRLRPETPLPDSV